MTFSSTQNYNFKKVEINGFLSETEDFILKDMPQTHRLSRQVMDNSFYINADIKQMTKAIYYIILFIFDKTPEGTFITMDVDTIMQDTPFIEISIKYAGDISIRDGKQNLLKPLLDIGHLGTELNVPISHKIIEGHSGSLDMKSEGGINTFIIRLPVVDRRSSEVSFERGHFSG